MKLTYDPDFGCTLVDGVPFDDVTFARLCEVCDGAGAPMQAVIAAIIRDVLEDDAVAHDPCLGLDVVRSSSNNDLH